MHVILISVLEGSTSVAKYLGYDPGGNGSHGVAVLEIIDGQAASAEVAALAYADDVVNWFQNQLAGEEPAGLGMDTLTLLHTGQSGWRPGDRWLRAAYPAAAGSVGSPNSLYGSMSLNGITVASSLRALFPNLVISETHPKVLYYALTGRVYGFGAQAPQMTAELLGWIGLPAALVGGPLAIEHAWDALISAHAVHAGVSGAWPQDLHTLPPPPLQAPADDVRQPVWPFGPTHYFWPPPQPVAGQDEGDV